jgi:hypothetical protein
VTDVLSEVGPLISGIANEFGRRHRVHGADPEDYGQQLALWVLENQAQVETWLDPEQWEPKDGTRMLAKALRNEAKDYSVDIKAQAVGYERQDLHFYGKGEVRSLLPAMFNPDAWHEPPQSEGRSVKAPSEGGNWVATLADLSQAFDKLDLYDRKVLEAFHKHGWTNKEMAEREDVTEQMMSYYHDRAIGHLVNQLGDTAPHPMRRQESRDPWRGRRAITNSTARARTSRTYDDE